MEVDKSIEENVNNFICSILIAHYNNATYFKDCYKSLLAQTFQNFEIIIVDDFSDNDDFFVVKELTQNDSRVSIYRNDSNKGVGYTKRKLVEFAKGNICGFVDPDDTLKPNAIERMISEHNKNPKASIINSNLALCDEKLIELNCTKVKQIENQNDPFFFNMLGQISHFVTFKKSYYNKTSGINAYFRIAEDQDIYIKLYEVGESIQIDDVLYNYRVNPLSLTNSSKQEISIYWHWVAAIKSAERRNVNIENLFLENFVKKSDYNKLTHKIDLLKKSRLLKFLYKLGLYKAYKYI